MDKLDKVTAADIDNYIKDELFRKFRELKIWPSDVIDETELKSGRLTFKGWGDTFLNQWVRSDKGPSGWDMVSKNPVIQGILQKIRKSNPKFRKWALKQQPIKKEADSPARVPLLQIPPELAANEKWAGKKKTNRKFAKWIRDQFFSKVGDVYHASTMDGLSMEQVDDYIRDTVFPKLKEFKLLPSTVVAKTPKKVGRGLKFQGWTENFIHDALYIPGKSKRQWKYVVSHGAVQHLLNTLRNMDGAFIRYFKGEEDPIKKEDTDSGEEEEGSGAQQQIGAAIAAAKAYAGIPDPDPVAAPPQEKVPEQDPEAFEPAEMGGDPPPPPWLDQHEPGRKRRGIGGRGT